MKDNIKYLIVKLGCGYYEIFIDLYVHNFHFHTVEYIPSTNDIVFHYFDDDDYDFEMFWEDFTPEWQEDIWIQLAPYFN